MSLMLPQNKVVKQLVILSGKGGTGKTSITAALVHLASQSPTKSIFVDADVDAANLALVTGAEHLEQHDFISSKLAQIDPECCNLCNECYEVCRYDAIELPTEAYPSYRVIDLLCDGCASCVYSCPQSAIKMIDQQDGVWYFSSSPYGPLFHAELFPAAENSGKLVTLIRQHANQFTENDGVHPLIIIDGPPGIGCPVIASSTGVDLALLVAEPGLSGSHDLQRVVQTLKHFEIPQVICINKADLYEKGVEEIKHFAEENNIQIIGELPFDTSIPKAMVQSKPVTEFSPNSPASNEIKKLWGKLQKILFD
jgi:MinD superfamily P-loop ATPase